jgi:hypothetical protein
MFHAQMREAERVDGNSIFLLSIVRLMRVNVEKLESKLENKIISFFGRSQHNLLQKIGPQP